MIPEIYPIGLPIAEYGGETQQKTECWERFVSASRLSCPSRLALHPPSVSVLKRPFHLWPPILPNPPSLPGAALSSPGRAGVGHGSSSKGSVLHPFVREPETERPPSSPALILEYARGIMICRLKNTRGHFRKANPWGYTHKIHPHGALLPGIRDFLDEFRSPGRVLPKTDCCGTRKKRFAGPLLEAVFTPAR